MSWKNSVLIISILVLSAGADAEYLTLEWKYNTKGGINDIYVSDLDNDGNKEIIAGSYDGKVYAFDKKGIFSGDILCSVLFILFMLWI